MTQSLELRASILVVDDVPENLALLNGILSPHHHVRVANGGRRRARARPG